MARYVWGHLSSKFQLNVPALSSVHCVVNSWLSGCSRRYLFCGLWEIWKERCTLLFEDTPLDLPRLLQIIYDHVSHLNFIVYSEMIHAWFSLFSMIIHLSHEHWRCSYILRRIRSTFGDHLTRLKLGVHGTK